MADGTRRSGRIPKQVAILLIGSDIEGRIFSEPTKTVVLSRHGAGIISEYKLSAEQELVVRRQDTNKEADVRVVGQIGSADKMYIYGVAFLQPNLNFWGIDFPALTESEKQASRLLLECSKCHARETVQQSDLESDVYTVNQSIMRPCKCCGSSTLWRQPTGPVIEEPIEQARPASAYQDPGAWQVPPETLQTHSSTAGATKAEAASFYETTPPAAVGPAATSSIALESHSTTRTPPAAPGKDFKKKDNRRKHVRTKVSFKACVRRTGFPNEVVACEDMSRGGVRFKSPKQYHVKGFIEIAVPYTPGDEAIFVPAQIAWVLELPEQKMFRCGVEYLRGK